TNGLAFEVEGNLGLDGLGEVDSDEVDVAVFGPVGVPLGDTGHRRERVATLDLAGADGDETGLAVECGMQIPRVDRHGDRVVAQAVDDRRDHALATETTGAARPRLTPGLGAQGDLLWHLETPWQGEHRPGRWSPPGAPSRAPR